MPLMLKSASTSLILLGILAIIIGIFAIAWPGVTILALVILFAVYAFMLAGLQGARAFTSRAGPGASAARADRPGGRGGRSRVARAHRVRAGHRRGGLGPGGRLRRVLRRVRQRGGRGHARAVHLVRAGIGR